jgi:mannose-6-phosphate isomerase-like protein (cupin superfamily)
MSITVVETRDLKNVELPATSLIDTHKIRALLVNLDARQSLSPCQMSCPVLYYVIEGRGVLTVADEQANLKIGSLVVVPADAIRSLAAHEHLCVLAVQSLS